MAAISISLIRVRWSAMASVAVLALLLIFQPTHASDLNDLLSPLLSPIFENVCKQVNCGRGTCKTSGNDTFSFECDCDPGWRQTLSDDDNNLKFLPCIIPKCNLTHSCSAAPPPGIQNKPRTNESIFEPCTWVDCGGGSCNKTSLFTYECVCFEGYYNLLNITTFSCYKDCSIGMDCQELGIPITNRPAPTTPSSATNDNSRGSRFVLKRGSLLTISSVVMYVAMLLLMMMMIK